MKIVFGPKFKKYLRKLPVKVQSKFFERLKLFAHSPYEKILDNHELSGEHIGKRSISITGDIRAIFEIKEKTIAYFTAIGSHSELYK